MLVGEFNHRTGLIDTHPRIGRNRMARNWRVTGTFVGGLEINVIVSAPNWVGGLRKGALEIKKTEAIKGRRLRGGLFSLSEIMDVIPNQPNGGQQLSLPASEPQALEQAPPVEEQVMEVESESEVPPVPEELE